MSAPSLHRESTDTLIGIDCERPTLQPSSYHACPNDSVTFTCHDSQIYEISWIVELYIPENYIAQLVSIAAGSQAMMATWTGPSNCTTHFIANPILWQQVLHLLLLDE